MDPVWFDGDLSSYDVKEVGSMRKRGNSVLTAVSSQVASGAGGKQGRSLSRQVRKTL